MAVIDWEWEGIAPIVHVRCNALVPAQCRRAEVKLPKIRCFLFGDLTRCVMEKMTEKEDIWRIAFFLN